MGDRGGEAAGWKQFTKTSISDVNCVMNWSLPEKNAIMRTPGLYGDDCPPLTAAPWSQMPTSEILNIGQLMLLQLLIKKVKSKHSSDLILGTWLYIQKICLHNNVRNSQSMALLINRPQIQFQIRLCMSENSVCFFVCCSNGNVIKM